MCDFKGVCWKMRTSPCDLIKGVWKMCQQDKIFPFSLRGSSDVNLKCSLQLPSPAQLLRIFTDYIRRRKRIWDFIAVSPLTVRSLKTQLVLTLHTYLSMEIPTCGEEKKGWKTAAASFNPCSNPKKAENSVPNTVRLFKSSAIATDHLSIEYNIPSHNSKL